jgi:dihydroxyacetone kinase
MRKIINDPEHFVDETIDGILMAHPGALRAAGPDRRALVRSDAGRAGKVGIVTGGGSGHLPVFLGYVGVGLCDGVAVGNVFSSPSADQIHAATRAVDGGAGVLYLYGNYGGDIYNFDLAADLAAADGIPTRTVLAADDVASAPAEASHTRRGVAGMVYAFKIAGAAADRGDDLDRVTELARRASANTRTMGVGLSPTILPAAGKPTFTLDEGEMELGIGIHGEPGVRRGPLETADRIADRLVGDVLDDLAPPPGAAVSVLVNGMGATPLEELYVLYRRAARLIADRGLVIRTPLIGNLVTSLEMAGASISVLLLDDELEELLNAPAASPFFRHGGGAELSVAPPAADQGGPADVADEPDTSAADRPPSELAAVLLAVLGRMPAHADELRDLDAALGDGDLGVTVATGATAAAEAIARDPSAPDADLLRRAGAAFASANPSTFAALVGGAVVAASATLTGSLFDGDNAVAFARAVTERIAERGHAERGDKTVLDALLAGIDAGGSLDAVIDAVRDTVHESAGWISARGRAAWLRVRSQGLQDPGMTAYLAFLTELRAARDEPARPAAGGR